MLRLLGRMGDRQFISYNYDQPEILTRVIEHIDQGADQTNRSLGEIRRGYNLMGMINLGRDHIRTEHIKDDYLKGDAKYWIEKILH